MSGTGIGGPDDARDAQEARDVLAGEFVLGTLDPVEAQRVADQMHQDSALAAAIAAWQARLAPLSRLAAPVAPPPAVWDRLAVSAGLRPAARTPVGSGWRAFWDSIAAWRWATGASLAAAAALLILVLLRPPAPLQQAAVLLPTHGATSGFLAEAMPGGGVTLRAVTPIVATSGKDLELWALPPGATLPVALGVIPAVAQVLAVAHPPVRLTPHTQLMVSLEPKGGSPTGQPTGPVLFAGTLLD